VPGSASRSAGGRRRSTGPPDAKQLGAPAKDVKKTPPATYMRGIRKWPRGDSDTQRAELDGRGAALWLLRRVAERVVVFRETYDESQAHLADRAGLEVEAVRRLEKGSAWPDFETVLRLADVVGIAIWDLTAEEEEAVREVRDRKRRERGF
jgi:ribosome-binding protein aMBF1 (putative translation factor)